MNDIRGAQQVGMQTAWLRRGRAWPAASEAAAPDFSVDDLRELVPLLSANVPTAAPAITS